MNYLLFGLILAGAAFVFLRVFAGASAQTLAAVLRWSLIVLAVVIGATFLLRGYAAAAVLPALLAALLSRYRYVLIDLIIKAFVGKAQGSGRSGPARGRSGRAGSQSEVRTDYLRMTLDQGSGEIDGEILKGKYGGRRVSSLEKEEMLDLLDTCHAEDQRSIALLSAYLDRAVGPEWREAYDAHRAQTGGGASGGSGNTMTRDEALLVLGLRSGATVDDIKRAHRELMQRFHPDHGGTDYMAAKINQAKDILLSN